MFTSTHVCVLFWHSCMAMYMHGAGVPYVSSCTTSQHNTCNESNTRVCLLQWLSEISCLRVFRALSHPAATQTQSLTANTTSVCSECTTSECTTRVPLMWLHQRFNLIYINEVLRGKRGRRRLFTCWTRLDMLFVQTQGRDKKAEMQELLLYSYSLSHFKLIT